MRTPSLTVVLTLLAFGAACRAKQASPAPKPSQAPATPKPSASASANSGPEPAAVAARYVACSAAFNRSDFDALAGCYSATASSRWTDSGLPEARGRAAVIDNLKKALKTAFPDGKIAPQLVLVSGTELVATGVFSGTHSGPLMGADASVPATNKSAGLLAFETSSFDADTLVRDEALLFDRGALLYQLGKSKRKARTKNTSGLVNAPVIVVAAHDATESANLEVVNKAWRAFAAEELPALAATLADDVVLADQTAPADARGKSAVVGAFDAFLRAFSAMKVECATRFAAGPYVASVCRFHATHDGDFGDLKRTGLPVTFTLAEVARLEGGLQRELVRFFDGARLASELTSGANDAGSSAQGVP